MIRSLLLIVSLIAISSTSMAAMTREREANYIMTCYYGEFIKIGKQTLIYAFYEDNTGSPILQIIHLDDSREWITSGRDCGFKRYTKPKPEAEKFEEQ